jgi:hypothetical protein
MTMTDPRFSPAPKPAGHRRRRAAAAATPPTPGSGSTASPPSSIAIGLLAILMGTLVSAMDRLRADPYPRRLPDLRRIRRPADPAAGNCAPSSRRRSFALTARRHRPRHAAAMRQILTNNTQFFVRDAVVADPDR